MEREETPKCGATYMVTPNVLSSLLFSKLREKFLQKENMAKVDDVLPMC